MVLQISIWKALFAARNGASLAGVELNDMIACNIIVNLTSGITSCYTMYELNTMVRKGEIAQRLLLPLGFRRHMFFSQVSSNIFWTVYSVLPPCIVAIIVYGFNFDMKIENLCLYVISAFLAFLVNFCFGFVMGLSVFWFKNSFFLSWMTGAFTTLFSGSFVPMWFFPGWLNNISLYLPFRYILFEPVSILLGKYGAIKAFEVIIAQIAWIRLLWALGDILGRKAQKIVFTQGG
jgi:ABC-2 type transport system permease protein